jgi:uncharacterized membrane protein
MGTKLPPPPVNPALKRHAQERRRHLENRLVDRITRFSGSMKFVYLHVIWFGSWIGFQVEHYPFGLLTMVVSLEAIFLSTFVMISQNRADEKRQALADQQWQTVQDEARQNERLLQLSDEILELTKAVHATTTAGRSTGNGQSPAAGALKPDRVPVGAATAFDPRWSS